MKKNSSSFCLAYLHFFVVFCHERGGEGNFKVILCVTSVKKKGKGLSDDEVYTTLKCPLRARERRSSRKKTVNVIGI